MTPAEDAVLRDTLRSVRVDGQALGEEAIARMVRALSPGAMLRDHLELLTAAFERIEEDRAANSTHYGSWFGGDPRDFTPDPECSTVEERELHRLAVAAAERDEPGARDLPQGFLAGTFSQDQRFGLGTTLFRDADGDGLIAALTRLVTEAQRPLVSAPPVAAQEPQLEDFIDHGLPPWNPDQ